MEKLDSNSLMTLLAVTVLIPAALLKKEALAQVFSCEFCEIFKKTFFHRTPPVAASA